MYRTKTSWERCVACELARLLLCCALPDECSNCLKISIVITTMNALRSTVRLTSRHLNQQVQKRHASGAAPQWTGIDKVIRDKFPEDWQGQFTAAEVHWWIGIRWWCSYSCYHTTASIDQCATLKTKMYFTSFVNL